MYFMFPLGLLGLIGIPVIIIIYIIKNRYTEQTVSSTYIWDVAERFLKNKKPISKLKGLLSLILQLLAVTVISLVIAHPVFVLKNAAKDFCFVLDGSGSMSIKVGDQTRFEKGRNEIKNIINSSSDGSRYTLVYVADSTRVVYEYLENKDKAIELLDDLEISYVQNSVMDSVIFTSDYFQKNTSTEVYLVTDKTHSVENAQLIDVSSDAENYSIVEANFVYTTNKVMITGKSYSYVNDADLTFKVKMDGEEKESTLKIESLGMMVTKDALHVKKETETYFILEVDKPEEGKDFGELEIIIENEDALACDNNYKLYNVASEHNYNAVVVSEKPFFIGAVLQTVSDAKIFVTTPDEFNSSIGGYDLYVFDSCAPSSLPKDGAIWIFNARKNIPNSGFTIQEEISLPEPSEIKYKVSSSSSYKRFTQGTVGSVMHIGGYVKYGLYRTFTTLLTFDGDPVVFTGDTASGNREVVFSFDLHDSDIVMTADWLILCKNFVNYSFPKVIEQSNYEVGESLSVNVLSSFKSIRVEAPSGKVNYLETNTATAEMQLTEVGEYVITVDSGTSVKTFKVWAKLPPAEGRIHDAGELYALHGEKTQAYTDGKFDKLWIIIAILGVVFIVDWIIYCYEQHQLQ
ncbi:MAG: VWA domain-containing protein [Bacilli bacterium]|nr:VWA domain-containing protein [Bacilli bacterium]